MSALSEYRLELRDEFLADCVRDLFRHDDRVRKLDLDVRFHRGVAHVTGAVEHTAELVLARSLIGRLDGVFGVWDRVCVGGRTPLVIDVGCGEQKQYPTNIGVDIRATSEVSVLADASASLPFADRSVDRVFLVHVLEHLIDFLPLVDDVHRVLRPDGVAYVLSPWWHHVNAVADPTHVRLIDIQTIKGICRRSGSSRRWYPLHAACDGATVFAELQPITPETPPPDAIQLSRFFD